MSVLVLVRATAKPGKGQEVVDMLTPFVGENPGLEGCLRVELVVDAGAPDKLVIVEEWTSVEAHKASLAALEEANALDDFLALLTEAPVRTYYAPIDS